MLFDILNSSTKTKNVSIKCTLIDEFFITLVKIRLGILHQDVAFRTNTAESDVSTIFHKWLDIMYRELCQLIAWPDRDKLYKTLPRKFKIIFFMLLQSLTASNFLLRNHAHSIQDQPPITSTRNTIR